MVRAADGSLYTGITTDVARRLAQHAGAAGRGARYLRGRGPLAVVYRRRIGERGIALRAEARLKRLKPAAKHAIVAAGPARAALLRALGLIPPSRR